MRISTQAHKSSIQGATKVSKRERSFELSLPTLVSGIDDKGEEFNEDTKILSISAQNALFWLKSKVLIGTPLHLSLQIPKTIILENRLNLMVSGKVVLVQGNTNNKNSQLVSMQLERAFKIRPSE
ncbi:MAG: hypothetical protein OEW23_12125 [Candidatus Aminicenantes bacterium]|nr:hypothetical protein [Candidatus Aminicenantes bacterium]